MFGGGAEAVDMRRAVRDGLPSGALDALAEALGLGQGELINIVGLPAVRRRAGDNSDI